MNFPVCYVAQNTKMSICNFFCCFSFYLQSCIKLSIVLPLIGVLLNVVILQKKQQLVFKTQCITKNRRTIENSLYVCFTITKLATSVADSRSQSQIVWVRLTFKLRDVHSITRH